MLSELHAIADRLGAEGAFLGGPPRYFARAGRNQLIVLLDQGLTPEARVLDVGCGCLRGGYWLIHFLRPDRYFGIEPEESMVKRGLDHLLHPELVAEKRPHFAYNDDFDFGVFGEQFDFVLGRSIWSHAGRAQISAMLDSFVQTARRDAAMLMSVVPPGQAPEHLGDEWIGRRGDKHNPGMVTHDPAWIAAECEARQLATMRLYSDLGQTWLKFYRRGEHQHLLDREPRNGRIKAFGAKAPP